MMIMHGNLPEYYEFSVANATTTTALLLLPEGIMDV